MLSSYDVECEILSCISRPVMFLENCHMFIQSDMVHVTLCNSRYVHEVLDIFDMLYCGECGTGLFITYGRL